MNYANIKAVDIANGPGVRVSLFVSGCTHYCKGCFNSEAWDFAYGKPFGEKVIEQIITYLNRNYISGLTLLGGEPLHPKNQEALLLLVRQVRERLPEKTIWCYTGYDFETDILGQMMEESEITRALIPLLDVLVDGRFMQEKRNLSLKFRGSENQRILNVRQSLEMKKAVLIPEYL